MTTLREVAQQALEALEHDGLLKKKQAITALRAVLAQQEQEPDLRNANPIGHTPPQKALQQAQFRADALAQQEREAIAQNLQSRLDAALPLEERRQEIAQPDRETEQEPVATVENGVLVLSNLPQGYAGPLYTHPPRREWMSLSDEEIWKDDRIMAQNARCGLMMSDLSALARAVEAALKEKNNG